MKVLHVIPSVGPLRGGPSFVIRHMAKGLAARGCEVHVAATDDNGPERLRVPLGTPQEQDGITYWYFPRQTRFYLASWPMVQWLARHAGDYDVIHIHALFSFAAIPAAYWARRRGVPYIVRPLGTLNRWGIQNRRPWLKRLSLRLIEQRILEHAAAVHYTSEQERDEAAEVARVPRPAVIPNPVDFQPARRPAAGEPGAPETAGKLRILYLSRLDRKKGLDLLLTAYRSVRERMPQAVLILGGTGDEGFVGELHEQARRLGVEDHIVWAGFLDGARKQAALAEADLYVLSSYSENFGIAVVEAMAAGLPVVVADGVAIHREIAAAGAGLVVPCDAAPLADAILRLLGDPALRAEMGRGGQRLAETFTPARVSRSLLDLYESITGQHDRAKALIS